MVQFCHFLNKQDRFKKPDRRYVLKKSLICEVHRKNNNNLAFSNFKIVKLSSHLLNENLTEELSGVERALPEAGTGSDSSEGAG